MKKTLRYASTARLKTKFQSKEVMKMSELGLLQQRRMENSPLDVDERGLIDRRKIENGEDRILAQARSNGSGLLARRKGDKILLKMIKLNNKRGTAHEPYTELCVFQQPEKVCFLTKLKYEVSFFAGLSAE